MQTTSSWPPGFRVNPLRFVFSSAPWRAFAWAVVLAVLAIPMLLASIILLPWAAFVAQIVDTIGRAGARWMRVDIADERGLFSWQKLVHLLAQQVLALIDLVLIFIFGAWWAGMVVVTFSPVDSFNNADFNLGFWRTTWPPAIIATCLFSMLLALIITAYLSWLLVGLSVWATWSIHAPTRQELERLESSREVLADAFTAERQRIERELHDGVQQYLTAIQLNLGALELQVGKQPGIEEAKHNAAAATKALRGTIRGIYPQVLKDKGLRAALEELHSHSGLGGAVTEQRPARVSARLTATAALLLYHGAAEGITNAVKHGAATEVLIKVVFGPKRVQLVVTDNGHGATNPETSGTGIAGLQERGEILGGEVAFTGNTLTITLPREEE